LATGAPLSTGRADDSAAKSREIITAELDFEVRSIMLNQDDDSS